MTSADRRVPLRMAVLISGSGTTLRNILACIDRGSLQAVVSLVVSSNPRAKGLQYAQQANAPTHIAQARDFAGVQEFSEDIFSRCRAAGVDLVVMGGFLKRIAVPDDFENRVTNIHPSLIPSFCGKGFYGLRIHQAVLDYGAKVSGCTVHFVDDEYDHGPIILQRPVAVLPDDTAESLAARVFEQECSAYPEALQLIAEGCIRVDGRRVVVSN